jgi:hypothetical protein
MLQAILCCEFQSRPQNKYVPMKLYLFIKYYNTITNYYYFDRTILTDIHIKHNRPDIIILNKKQKQAYLLDIAVPNSHNITQT